jgi:Flp pilus assembly protein TadD
MISLAAGVADWITRLKRPVVAAVVIALGIVSFARARAWADDVTLWSDAAAKSPKKARPKLQLARALAQSDPSRAEALLLEAQRLEPDNAAVHTQLGSLWLDQRQPDRALREFEAALRLDPRSASALSNRGTALYTLGRMDEAEGEFHRALERDPCHFNARHNLLLLYRSQGKQDAYQRLADPPPVCSFTPAQLADLRN